jgi:hypothetical protein
MMTCGLKTWMAPLAGLVLFAPAAMAQQNDDLAARVGLTVLVGEPLGEMDYLVNESWGLQLSGALAVAAEGHLLLRSDFGFMIYGHEHQEFCDPWAGCRIGWDMTTDNAILFAGLGPEIVLVTGAIEPYVNLSAGVSYFLTTTSLGDDYGYDDFAHTTNYDDVVFAWRAGGGVRARVSNGRAPVYLDFAVERHQNGVANYLTEGDILDHPNGNITLFPNRTEANMVTFRFGVSVGIPRGRGHD